MPLRATHRPSRHSPLTPPLPSPAGSEGVRLACSMTLIHFRDKLNVTPRGFVIASAAGPVNASPPQA